MMVEKEERLIQVNQPFFLAEWYLMLIAVFP